MPHRVRDTTLSRRLHALAQLPNRAQQPRQPARARTSHCLADAQLDRLDHGAGLLAQRNHPAIEFFEPRHLQQFRPRHVEHEGGHAEAEKFCEYENHDRAQPVFIGEQPQPDQLERKQRQYRYDEDDQRHRRRQRIDLLGKPQFEGAQRNPRHHARDHRLEMIPQPRLDQKDQCEQYPQWLQNAAQHERSSTIRFNRTYQIWIARLPTASAASLTASDRVGWAWQVRARSSAEPPNSISTTASWIISPASAPMM